MDLTSSGMLFIRSFRRWFLNILSTLRINRLQHGEIDLSVTEVLMQSL